MNNFFDDIFKSKINYEKYERQEVPVKTTEEVFKESIVELIALKERDEIIDNTIKQHIKSDFMSDLAYPITERYFSLCVDLISALWEDSNNVKEEIYYYLYDCKSEKTSIIEVNDKEYNVFKLEDFIAYLKENYKLK